MEANDFEKVLETFEPLIKGQLKKLHLYQDHEEFYQVGVIALWEAYRHFDDEKGCFEAYAYQTVRGRLLTKLRRERLYSERTIFLDEQSNGQIPDVDDPCETSIMLLSPYLTQLTPREQLWVYEAVILDKKREDIAKEQGVSVSTVASWRKQALRKLRETVKGIDCERL
ncbi:sigma-70 family RNA polymerase sigma factor [Halalkalibacter urbisdiaboli]|uniref:sigma-70 family RNA polymerase sigma factor n=1 Tax=Halalkalibacter urbisdiaboli TaxID=1960589 RepID=UPI000B44E60E|nr:sigma-70 family RNA polymerase sigma factor [Halalkalibacter urbisdiaboli]